jgi:hypothetical protein
LRNKKLFQQNADKNQKLGTTVGEKKYQIDHENLIHQLRNASKMSVHENRKNLEFLLLLFLQKKNPMIGFRVNLMKNNNKTCNWEFSFLERMYIKFNNTLKSLLFKTNFNPYSLYIYQKQEEQ